MDNFIFPLILRGVESGFAEKGFTLQLAWTNNTVTGETKAIELFMEKKLDGLILEPTRSALPFVNRNLFDELLKRNLPLVFIDSYYPEIDIPYVVMDDVKAGYIATEYLIRNGHKDIAFVLPHINRQGHLRYSGYTQALTEAGLPIDDNHIIWYSSKENMHQILNSKELLDTLSRCSAVICYNDSIALELIGFVSKNNFRIPDDISVIGIDGSEIAQFTGLTSVVHPARQLGETAVKLLLSMINGGEGKNYIFPPSLVERNTVKKI